MCGKKKQKRKKERKTCRNKEEREKQRNRERNEERKKERKKERKDFILDKPVLHHNRVEFVVVLRSFSERLLRNFGPVPPPSKVQLIFLSPTSILDC